MKSAKSAARYAKALLELAIEKNSLTAVESNVNAIIRAGEETGDFSMFLNSPLITGTKKLSILTTLFSDFENVTMDFLALVTKNGRESQIIAIAQSFNAQLKDHRGIIPVSIVSARKLEEATRKKIVAQIQKTVSGTLELTESVDESLIGGFIVRMGDKQIDASVLNQLARLKQELIK